MSAVPLQPNPPPRLKKVPGRHVDAKRHPDVLARYINDNLVGPRAERHNIKFVKLPKATPPKVRPTRFSPASDLSTKALRRLWSEPCGRSSLTRSSTRITETGTGASTGVAWLLLLTRLETAQREILRTPRGAPLGELRGGFRADAHEAPASAPATHGASDLLFQCSNLVRADPSRLRCHPSAAAQTPPCAQCPRVSRHSTRGQPAATSATYFFFCVNQ